MIIHVLNNNIVRKRGLLAEHGLSLLIEFNNKLILFDTGQTDVYIKNAKTMGLDLAKVSYIILSHGHYDHCGGLEFFPQETGGAKIFIRESAFAKKIAINPDKKTFRDIGISWGIDEKVFYTDSFVLTNKKESIESGIYLVSGIKNNPSADKLSESILVLKDGLKKIDAMEDEQILVLKNEDGINIIVGCSHPGIISCIEHVIKAFPNDKINTLIGGMHLEHVGEDQLLQIIHKLNSFGIKKIIPLHCTGIRAITKIKEYFTYRCEIAYTGDTLKF